MKRTVTAAVQREDDVYVARALEVEVEVASQGDTIHEALANLGEALELFFDDDAGGSVEMEHPFVTTLEIGRAS